MKKILTCVALSVILFTGCSFKGDEIIKVNGKSITQSQFDKAFDKEINNSMFKAFGGADNFVKSDTNVMYLIYKQKVSKGLIIKELINSEIDKKGIKVTDEDVKLEMKSVIEKVGSKEQLNKILKQRGISNSEFIADLKSQIEIKKLVKSVSNIKISDSDAEKYYKNNIDKFKHSEQVRASHILVAADTLDLIRTYKKKYKKMSNIEINDKINKALEEKRLEAESILRQVKANPESFEKIAQERSDDKVSGERGGELGFFSKETMMPEFSAAAFSMKPDTISDKVVKTNYGYHIIKVTDTIEPGTTPFVKVKDEIKFFLETQENLKVLKNITDGLLKTAKIEYIDDSFNPEKMKLKVDKINKENVRK